ncbi:hypothetical protein NMY22_g19795 [Coprinellus aureogranulatus]|nr:hypothetical protein NMY22_g19795 [Coprinellus aureogranulatus]
MAPSNEPLPTKARRFVISAFEAVDGVPSQEWFNEHIPLDDPHGAVYYALLDLEKRAAKYFPDTPKSIWDLLPLHMHVIMSLISGCAYYQQNASHAVKCTSCEVCTRADKLLKIMVADPHYNAWYQMYGEEASQESFRTAREGKASLVPGVAKYDLDQLKKRLDGSKPAPKPVEDYSNDDLLDFGDDEWE